MAIQLSYVEKDVEDLIEQNAEHYLGIKFITRQFRMPVGIIDVIAKEKEDSRVYYVIEIKNGPIDASAYVQVVRYAKWLNSESAKHGRRIFVPVLIGNNLSYDLTAICEYFYPGTGEFHTHYGRVYYRLFNFDPIRGVSFAWSSNLQKEHRDKKGYEYSHIEHLIADLTFAEHYLNEARKEIEELKAPPVKKPRKPVLVKSEGAA